MVAAVNDCTHSWEWPDSPKVRELGLGVAAIRYAYHGFAVLPLERGGKKPHRMLPLNPGGVHNATTEMGRIISWWTRDPAANVGVACGQVSELVVLDLDVKADADGVDSITRFMHGIEPPDVNRRLALPPAPHARTPSGGWHLWMRYPQSFAERPGILPGVDIKGDGGYVVAPPSMKLVQAAGLDTERGEPVPVPYEWTQGCPCTLALMPRWLAELAALTPERPVTGGLSDAEPPDEQAALRGGIAVGSRNRELYRLACSLYRRYGTGPDGAAVVLGRIEGVWLAGSRTDMPRREVLTIVESARRFIEGQQQAERSVHVASADWRARHGT